MERKQYADELKKTIAELYSQGQLFCGKEKELRLKLETVQEMHTQKMRLQVQLEQQAMQFKHENARLQAAASVSSAKRAKFISALQGAHETDLNLTTAIFEAPNIEAQNLPTENLSSIIFDPLQRKEYLEMQKYTLQRELKDLSNQMNVERKLIQDLEEEDQQIRANYNIETADALDIASVIANGVRLEIQCNAVRTQINKIKSPMQ